MYFFDDLSRALAGLNARDHEGQQIPVDEAISRIVRMCRFFKEEGTDIYFVGNGGSAAIASHMAADWTKAGKFRAYCFNDPAAMSAYANDCGVERMFAEPLSRVIQKRDILFAISSSGNSKNIREAVSLAREKQCPTITLTGLMPTNHLRQEGTINFYVDSMSYGIVECAHAAILHGILDQTMQRP